MTRTTIHSSFPFFSRRRMAQMAVAWLVLFCSQWWLMTSAQAGEQVLVRVCSAVHGTYFVALDTGDQGVVDQYQPCECGLCGQFVDTHQSEIFNTDQSQRALNLAIFSVQSPINTFRPLPESRAPPVA